MVKAVASAIWNGTAAEGTRLHAAIHRFKTCAEEFQRHNCCECWDDDDELCVAHSLIRDQVMLNHLLFVYRMRLRFILAEFSAEVKVKL